jgi:hypothetical protein
MNKLVWAIVAVIILTDCTTTSTNETKDSLSLEPDTLSINEKITYDTVWVSRELPLRSAVDQPQYLKSVAYVYNESGLFLYENESDCGDSSKAVSLLKYGDRVELIDDLVNNLPSDVTSLDNLRGRYIAAKTSNNAINYIFSGYLTNMPVPAFAEASMSDLKDYFLQHFQLVENPMQRTPRDTTEEAKYSFEIRYRLESDIRILHHGYYEGGGTTVTLPKGVSLQEAWLVMRSFSDFKKFRDAFPEFPLDAGEKTVGEGLRTTVTRSGDGKITKMYLEDTSGCVDEFYVIEEDGRVKVVSDGGC